MRRTASLIIGGGPAGAAAAIDLARAGLKPLLIERNAETSDGLCGGFLSWTTIRRLRELGVDPLALGARPVQKLAVFSGRCSAIARMPAPAAALSRRTLDAALLACASEAGARIERGVSAQALEQGRVRLGDGGEIAASCLILATGKHELRGAARPHPSGDTALGLRWRLNGSATLARLASGKIELHLFRGGYAGLVIQEDGSANLCLAVRRSRFSEAEGRPERLLAALAEESPVLAIRLAGAIVSPAQAVANVPYGWRAQAGDPDLYRVGDQAGVIPSLAGEGIGVAILSGQAAADAIARGEPAGNFQRAFSRRLRAPFGLAHLLWRGAEIPATASLLVGAVAIAPALASLAATLTRV